MLVGTIEPKQALTGYISGLDMTNTIELYKTEQETFKLAVKDQDGNPENLTDGILNLTIKRDLDDAEPLIIKTSVVHLASFTLDDNAGSPVPAFKIESVADGLAGNTLSITTTLTSKFTTTLNNGATLQNGDMSATLTDASGSAIGSVITVTDGPVSVNLLLTGVTGNVVAFDAISGLASPIADGSPVVDRSFDIVVKDDGSVVETHTFLSAQVENAVDYVVTRLLSDSEYIRATDLESATAIPNNRPEVATNQLLSGGALPSGGITVTDALAGLAEIQFESADTENLKPRTYYYDLKYVRGDSTTAQYVVPRSAFVVKQPVG